MVKKAYASGDFDDLVIARAVIVVQSHEHAYICL
jgi:hypothetical protein